MSLLLLSILLPPAGGLLLFLCRPGRVGRTALVSAALLAQAGLTLALALVSPGAACASAPFLDAIPLAFRADGVGLFFALLFCLFRLPITLFAFRYMSHEEGETRFFGFWLLAAGVLNALAFADNLLTFYLCYELMTLTTLPLVLHEITHEARMAGLKYLLYSVAGALLALLGIFFLTRYDATLAFVPGGFLGDLAADPAVLRVIAALLIGGFCCKAGLFPVHGWLPTAHPVAPAPASALLSGCITKCGVLGIVRAVYFVAGPDLLRGSWVQTLWLTLALVTIFLGSMMAYLEPVTKRRLAYSTVSQLSYILFGLALLTPAGLEGALLHTLFHMIVKSGLFLCAGAILFQTGRPRVSQLAGLGRAMPLTFGVWTLLALSLVGIPPFAGFWSKWVLATAGLDALPVGLGLAGAAVLLLSALLTAGYLFVPAVRAFFPVSAGSDEGAEGAVCDTATPREVSPSMAIPLVLLALCALLPGILTGPISAVLTRITAGLF